MVSYTDSLILGLCAETANLKVFRLYVKVFHLLILDHQPKGQGPVGTFFRDGGLMDAIFAFSFCLAKAGRCLYFIFYFPSCSPSACSTAPLFLRGKPLDIPGTQVFTSGAPDFVAGAHGRPLDHHLALQGKKTFVLGFHGTTTIEETVLVSLPPPGNCADS